MKKTIKSQIFDFVAKKGTATRKDIAKFYVEEIKGRKFDPIIDKNIMCGSLSTPNGRLPGYLRFAAGKDRRYLAKLVRNEYFVAED